MNLLAAAAPDPILPVSWCRWGGGGADLAPPQGLTLITAWQLDAVALIGIVLLAAAYGWGVIKVRRAHPHNPWSRWRTASFGAGLFVAFLATHSSIAVYDMTVFSVHMIQHLMLIMISPAFLAAGRPLTLLLHAVRNPWHARVKRLLRSAPVRFATFPPVALAQYAAVVGITHLTGVMDQIMQRPWLGQAEHLLYLASGYLFLILLIGDEPIPWRLSMPSRVLLVTISTAVDTFVGIILMMSTEPILLSPHPNWVADELADTHAGGAIMWVFGDGLMAVIMVSSFVAWARLPERAQRRSRGWLEDARLSTFTSIVGGAGPDAAPAPEAAPAPAPATTAATSAATTTAAGSPAAAAAPPAHEHRLDLDQDDAALDAYNAWLGRLHEEEAAGRKQHR